MKICNVRGNFETSHLCHQTFITDLTRLEEIARRLKWKNARSSKEKQKFHIKTLSLNIICKPGH